MIKNSNSVIQISNQNLSEAYLISTIFVGSGCCTLIQTIFGNRLPILQGGTFSFLVPTFALMARIQINNDFYSFLAVNIPV